MATQQLDDDPCACGGGHTRSEHGYDPDADELEVRECDSCHADTSNGTTCPVDGFHRCEDCHGLHAFDGRGCRDCAD